MFILHGSGRNGKSSLIETLGWLLGDYAMSVPSETLMARYGDGGASEDVARLRGARLVTAIETEEGRRLAEAKIKQLTGGDVVTARHLWGHFFDFVPTFKIWYATNHLPEIRGTEDAIWRRLLKMPFAHEFEDKDRIMDYAKLKLYPELSGILTWAVLGCLDWQRRGLNAPQEVLAAVEEYRGEQDLLARFISERCRVGPREEVPAGELYRAYRYWAEEQGDRPLTSQLFGRRLNEKGFTKKKSGVHFRIGLSLNPDEEKL
jgi:putative DNA primase/helicase